MPSAPADELRDIFDAGGRGLQHHGLRRTNERAVLTVIGFNPGVSNADISRLSGLAPQTVSAILGQIDNAGLIMRGEVLRGRRGQPATPIFLNPEGAFAIGVEIGWRHVDVLLLDLHAKVLGHERRTYDYPDPRTLFDEIAGMVERLAATLTPAQRKRLEHLGVAAPGHLAASMARLDVPADVAALWEELDPAAELMARTGLETSLFNDGNAACWAELIAFPRPRPGNFVYLLLSRFVGAGIVGESLLWEGPTGNSANLGFMLVGGKDGKPQTAHEVASVTALAKRLLAAGFDLDVADVYHWPWASFGSVLDGWIDDSAKALAQVVFNTMAVMETELVVLDAIFDRAVVERLVERLRTELAALPIQPFTPPQVVAGHTGALAPAIGAAELILYRRFFSRSFAAVG